MKKSIIFFRAVLLLVLIFLATAAPTALADDPDPIPTNPNELGHHQDRDLEAAQKHRQGHALRPGSLPGHG